jgi:protein TonB
MLGLLTAALLLQTPLARAQSPDSLKVYTYVEQMPAMPGGGGNPAITAAIEALLSRQPGASCVGGRTFVTFVVNPAGKVGQAQVLKGQSSACNEAVLAAVRQLPALQPGKQNGRAVAVSLTLGIGSKSR